MKLLSIAIISILPLLAVSPLLAQTQIGGGTCSSSSVNGTYTVAITGRAVNAAGNFTNVLQSIGSATFDGQSKVALTLTSDTNQAVGGTLNWSGTYSVQANCAGAITITAGGTASLNLVAYAQGANFLITGSDSVYSYNGSGNRQPAACSAAALSGVYTINATGFVLTSPTVSGAAAGTGLLQFDGLGHLTVNFSLTSAGAAVNTLTLTGTYSAGSNCLGSAALTDSKGNSYIMSLSVVGGTAVSTATVDVTLSQNAKFILSGTARAIYGQPTAALRLPLIFGVRV